jgi:hypothetical protein
MLNAGSAASDDLSERKNTFEVPWNGALQTWSNKNNIVDAPLQIDDGEIS